MSIRTRLFTFLLLLCWNLPANAQVDTTMTLPAVTITATRGAITTADAPARVTLLNATAIRDAGVQNVAQLLETRTGSFIRHYGAGGLASLSLRGTSASQTLILLDGHRLTDPQLGQVDLSLLPTLLFSSVEVMHGAGSALYGSEGMGGVVHLRTEAPEHTGLTLQAGYGAFGTRSTSALLARRWNHLTGRVVIDYARSEGNFRYLNTALFPAREVPRTNADRERFSLYAALQHTGTRYRLQGAGWWNTAERGLPGPGTRLPIGERQWDRHLRSWMHAEFTPDWGRWKIGGMWQRSHLRYLNPQLRLDETGRRWSATLDTEVHVPLRSYALLNAGLTTAYRSAQHPSLSEKARERQAGLFLNGTLHKHGLRIYPSVRLDTYRPTGAANQAAWSPRLGLNWQPWAAQALHFKTSLGRAFRVPTFNDRFWQPGGNPALRPEQGWTLDAGVVWHPGPLQLELTGYTSRIRNQIVWQPLGSLWIPENVSRVRSRGLETSMQGTLGQRTGLHLHGGVLYTLTDAMDQTTDAPSFDQPLRYVPKHQLKTFAGFGWRPVRLDLSGRYIGQRFITTDGRQALDGHWTMDAQIRVQHAIRKGTLTLSLQLKNLLDRAYAVIKDYPMPPRHARAQLTLTY